MITLPDKDKWTSPDEDVQYDPAFVAYLGLIFDPSRAIVDVGANVGKMARFFAARTRERVICFEPAPSTFAALEENIKAFPNIEAYRVAISDVSGSQRLVGDGTVTAHLTQSDRGKTVDVETKTLDEAVPALLNVGLIKIDCEGAELRVLRGARETIARHRPLLAIEMIDQHLVRGGTSRAEIFAFLGGLGYTRAVNKYGMREEAARGTGASDVFFLPDKTFYAPRLYIGYSRQLGRAQGSDENPAPISQLQKISELAGQTLDLFADPAPAISEPVVEAVDEVDDDVELATPVPLNGQPLLFDEIPTRAQTAPVRLLSVYVHFENRDDLADFARLIGQPVSSETTRIWYPADVAYSGAIWDLGEPA